MASYNQTDASNSTTSVLQLTEDQLIMIIEPYLAQHHQLTKFMTIIIILLSILIALTLITICLVKYYYSQLVESCSADYKFEKHILQ